MEYFFSQGEEVVVVCEEPDPEFADSAIPVGTHGIYVGSSGTAEHPATGDDMPVSWVLFDLPIEAHRWASISTKDSTKIEACLFDYMIAPAKDDTFEPGNLEDLL